MNPSDSAGGGIITQRNPSKKRPRPDIAPAENASAANLTEPPPSSSTAVIEEQTEAISSVSPGGSAEQLASKPAAAKEETLPPLKSTLYRHLRSKYTADLSYMLVEFQKLERQLLGAGAQSTAGSIERREKLRSFIQHLEETLQQIADNCQTEQGCPDVSKQHEENVQKLEEHILGSLLPVKDRLRKQLAAQQGAKHNPVGIGSAAAPSSVKPTFLAKTPNTTIDTAGSKLTQKLHGGANDKETTKFTGPTDAPPKVLYAGLALGSTQVKSSMHAAGSAHNLIVQHPTLLELQSELHDMDTLTADSGDTLTKLEQHFPLDGLDDDDDDDPHPLGCSEEAALSATAQAAITSYERQRRKWKRKKRRRKQRTIVKVPVSKKQRGPRKVEYTCAVCNENYNSTCEGNPWWALTQHECPKCHKQQIPKVDIGAPANAIEYHPALLAHAEDGGTTEDVVVKPLESCSETSVTGSDDDGSDEDDDDDEDVDDESMFSSDDDSSDDFADMSPGDRAENEKFGLEYEGPKLNDKDARRLLTLMLHASTCPCRHESSKAEEVCRSAKWLMLHVRDCPGTTLTDDVCPFPWCRKVKHLLYHLLSCTVPQECPICSCSEMEYNMSRLRHLNVFRLKSAKESLFKMFKDREDRRSDGVKISGTSISAQPVKVQSEQARPKESCAAAVSTASSTQKSSATAISYQKQPPTIPTAVVCIQRTEEPQVGASQLAFNGTKENLPTGASKVTTSEQTGEATEVVNVVKGKHDDVKDDATPDSTTQTIVVPMTATSSQPDKKPAETLVVQ